ncbi:MULTISPECIES: hypothetical protein [Paenibacillus]|uniref:Phage protein n=1 Tax=Paenibacillus polymyxa TaxID=1406 RepID=A0ABX2ZDM0_PAEPO|nr:hypothetical protein [Paenibacillus polymyxa]ODA08262.1 hypothetical protein A7312_27740 [Paenibacillus polymyxa]
MKIKKCVIELANGRFAKFEQESDTDIKVYSRDFYNAEFLSEDYAETQFYDLVNQDCGWTYFGECIEPKEIRKVEIELI